MEEKREKITVSQTINEVAFRHMGECYYVHIKEQMLHKLGYEYAKKYAKLTIYYHYHGKKPIVLDFFTKELQLDFIEYRYEL